MADERPIEELSDEEFLNYINSVEIQQNSEANDEVQEQTEEQGQEQVEQAETEESQPEKEEQTSESSSEPESEKQESVTQSINPEDYEKFYKKVMQPFKANGKYITPENADDIVSLMQMGANYVKKMTQIKPAVKLLKTLEKENITEDDLKLFIDVKKGDNNALKKLLKEQKFDPIVEGFDLNEEVDYKPKNKMISDDELSFVEALDEIKESPFYDKTKDIVSNKWDEQSKKVLLSNPELLKKLHEEVELGRFDIIQEKVANERLLGRHLNKSDLDAYIDVVTRYVNSNKVEEQLQQKYDKSKAKPVNKSTTTPGKSKYTIDFLSSLSDEDFLKLEKKNLF